MTTPGLIGNNGLPPDPAPQTPGRWVRIVLAVSLALNLAVAGVITGTMFRRGGPAQNGMMARDVGFGPFTEALSTEDRAQLRRAFLAAVPEMRDNRRAVRADFADLLTQMRAATLDPDALRQVLDRQSERTAERLDLGQRLIFDLVKGMTVEARLEFADRLEQSLAKRPKRRNGASDR